jgi:hypothetical protein
MSGARPVAEGLGRVERSLKLAHSVVSRRLGLNRIIRVIHGVCKHSRYSEVLLAGARGFYLSLLKMVFTLKSCVSVL